MSGFQRMPTQDEVSEYDPNWVSDMKLLLWEFNHQKEDHPIQQMMDAHVKQGKAKEAANNSIDSLPSFFNQ